MSTLNNVYIGPYIEIMIGKEDHLNIHEILEGYSLVSTNGLNKAKTVIINGAAYNIYNIVPVNKKDDQPRDFWIREYEEVLLSVSLKMTQDEIFWFVENFWKEIDTLMKLVGNKNVKCRWGFIQWVS